MRHPAGGGPSSSSSDSTDRDQVDPGQPGAPREQKARLAVNALALQPNGSGVQTYAKELLAALSCMVDADIVAAVRSDATDLVPPSVLPVLRPVVKGPRRLWEGARTLLRGDILHGLDAQIPLRAGCPTVVTIHDLGVYDVPWAFSRQWVVGTRVTTAHALRHADEVISVSGFTAERIRKRSGRDATVVPLAPAPGLRPPPEEVVADVRNRYALPPRFALFLGTIEPRKDVATLASACRESEVPLVLAGRVSPATRVPQGAHALGYVPATDLQALYGAATVVAYPSLYEGFGLPPIEAMACGAPVVAYRIPPLEELVGDSAVLTPPRDVGAMAHALRSLVFDVDRRSAVIESGLELVARLSWESTASKTLDVYRKLGLRV